MVSISNPQPPPATMWEKQLDAILQKQSSTPITITKAELPSVDDILLDPKNIAPLKKKLEELKAMLSNPASDMNEESRDILDDYIKFCEKGLERWDRKLDAIIELADISSNIVIEDGDIPEIGIINSPSNIDLLKDKIERLKQKLSSRKPSLFDPASRERLERFILACENGLACWDRKLDAIMAKAASHSDILVTKEDLPEVNAILQNPGNYDLLKKKVDSLKHVLVSSKSVFQRKSQKCLEEFIFACEKELARWERKLDAVLAKELSPSSISIDSSDLPTVGEIVKSSEALAQLKGYVERLKYFRLNQRIEDVSRSYLEMFIDNSEKAFFEQEQMKKPDLNRILTGEKWLSGLVLLLLVVALAIPVLICIHTSKNGFYSDSMQVERELLFDHESSLNSKPAGPAGKTEKPVAGPAGKTEKPAGPADKNERSDGVKASTSSKYHSVSHTNWVAILGFAIFVLVYFVFVVMLVILFFKTLKKIRQHQHRQILHDDLSALASLMSIKIDSNDATRLEMRKRIMKIMMPDDTED